MVTKAAAENGLLKDNKNNKTTKDMGKVKTQELTDVERERIVKALTLYAEEAERDGHPTVQHNCETLAQRIEQGKVIIYTIN